MNRCLFLLLFISLFSACKQDGQVIVPSRNPFEVMPIKLKQNVLLESFSEESQSTTVTNSELIDQLKAKYTGRLISANFHRNDFLATSYADFLAAKLGGLVFNSKGCVHRKVGSNTIGGSEDNLLLLSPVNWDYAIEKIVNQDIAPLSISLETTTDANGKGLVNIYIAHKESITSDTRLVVYLLEDNIQPIFQVGAPTDYLHQNVFKNVLTSYDGDAIDLSKSSSKGEIIKRSLSGINLADYNVQNLKVIAFIYSYSSDSRKIKVINVQEVNFFGVHYWDV
ncbi:MAG: Omp28-related outer membrane protein [Bacteroidetes bacterium]|nr:Omp28-related outer membrane protein [Bacteroidota bacterium]